MFVVYKWLTSDHDYFEKLGIPYEKPWPIFGNNLKLIFQKESLNDIIDRSYKKYKNLKVYGYFNFLQPSFMLTDVELIKKITITDFSHFINHDTSMEFDELFSRSLFSLRDKKWRDMRTTLSPIFTSSKMKMMFGLLSDHSRDFIKFMEEQVQLGNNINVDVMEIFRRYTADGISTAVLGFVGNSVRDKNSLTCRIANQMEEEFNGTAGAIKFMLASGFPKLVKFFDIQLVSKEVKEFFKRVVMDVMNEREQNGISRPDVIQLMLQARKGQLQVKADENDFDKEMSNFAAHEEMDVSVKNDRMSHFSDMDWIAQGFLFFGAGFNTTTSLLQNVLYDLACNPEIESELITEIDNVKSKLGSEPVNYETLHKMKFLDMVISESLRLRPPAGVVDRYCNKDYEFQLEDGRNFKIPKGKVVLIPIYQLQHDPEYFPNPEKFNPHRFRDENSIIKGTFLPFGLGARNCVY